MRDAPWGAWVVVQAFIIVGVIVGAFSAIVGIAILAFMGLVGLFT